MENREVSNQLLKNKYNLHATPEVRTAARFTRIRTGEKVPQDPNAQIQNYLDRMQEIFSPNFDDPEGRDVLKQRILDRYTTKFEDIPESYWRGQEKILRESGQMGDYNRYSDEEKLKWKRELSQGLLDDQRASLKQWIDYFASSDSSYLLPSMKYWVFRNIVKLSEFDKEKGEFPERSKGTVKMFPDINPEALAYVNDAVIKKLNEEGFEFGKFAFDLTSEQKEKFQQALSRENFAQMYAWANEQIAPIPHHLLPVTAGTWIKYDKGSDSQPLVSSIRGKGTGWCIAADSTAQNYLQVGDFYVYYTNDENNNPTIPRLAIRMEGNNISEVRGIDHRQNVDPYMPDILLQKLEEFPDKANYLKKASDMEHLTEIDNRVQAGLPLSVSDLTFLYELNSPIEGFGYDKDPRVEEIRSQRNPEEDMLAIFDCEPQQIARSASEIDENTRVFVGELSPGIFQTLKNFNIEHIYTAFPEGKIRFDSVEVEPKDGRVYEKELKDAHINVAVFALSMMKKKEFKTLTRPETVNLVRLSVRDLDTGNDYPTATEVFKRAEELGLTLCPPETGPAYRLKYQDQPLGDWLYVGMEPITDSEGNPSVFLLVRDENGLWLSSYWANPDDEWDPEDEFLFSSSKLDS